MRVFTLLAIITVSFATCRQKAKELPSYFCNENVEHYFAGNDSLPVININPNDSFGVIRETVDSLYKESTVSTFRMPIIIDSTKQLVFLETEFFYYLPDSFQVPISCYSLRNILEVNLNTDGTLIIEGKKADSSSLKKMVLTHLTNYGKNPYYSDAPNRAIVFFTWDKQVNKAFFNTVLKNLIEAYINALNSESWKKYNKNFCELDSIKHSIITDIIPFNFKIDYPETKLKTLVDTSNLDTLTFE